MLPTVLKHMIQEYASPSFHFFREQDTNADAYIEHIVREAEYKPIAHVSVAKYSYCFLKVMLILSAQGFTIFHKRNGILISIDKPIPNTWAYEIQQTFRNQCEEKLGNTIGLIREHNSIHTKIPFRTKIPWQRDVLLSLDWPTNCIVRITNKFITVKK